MCSHVGAGERIIERNSVACGELAAGAKFGPGPRPVLRYPATAARFETLVTQSGADHGSDYRPSLGVTARGRREIMPRTQHRFTASRATVRYASSRRVLLERHPALHAHIVQFVVHEGVGTHEATVSPIGPAGHRLPPTLGSSRWPTFCSVDTFGWGFDLGQAGRGGSIASYAAPVSLTCSCWSCPAHKSSAESPKCPFYPSSSLTDPEWTLLEPLLPLPGNHAGRGGRPEKWPRRLVLDAVFYLVRGGIGITALPTTQPSTMPHNASQHEDLTQGTQALPRPRALPAHHHPTHPTHHLTSIGASRPALLAHAAAHLDLVRQPGLRTDFGQLLPQALSATR